MIFAYDAFIAFFGSILVWSMFAGKYEGDKPVRSLRFKVKDYFVHVHHWIVGALLLLLYFVIGYNSGIILGILLGTIVQGLCYRDRGVIVYKCSKEEEIYAKWKKRKDPHTS